MQSHGVIIAVRHRQVTPGHANESSPASSGRVRIATSATGAGADRTEPWAIEREVGDGRSDTIPWHTEEEDMDAMTDEVQHTDPTATASRRGSS